MRVAASVVLLQLAETRAAEAVAMARLACGLSVGLLKNVATIAKVADCQADCCDYCDEDIITVKKSNGLKTYGTFLFVVMPAS